MTYVRRFRFGFVPVLLAAVLGAGLLLIGCNDHNFSAVADIKVAPASIDYPLQRAPQYTEQILITNDSVSARLEIYEINFEDSAGSPFTTEDVSIFDQTVNFERLQETSNITGEAIRYERYMGGVVSDVACVDDSYCNCDPNIEGAENCRVEVTGGTREKERMGEMFRCIPNPIEATGTNVCVAHYRFYNGSGETKLATWGGQTEISCENSANCSRLGPGYICDTGLGKCVSDIKATFALEYGLEQLVAVDDDVIVNKDNAATWMGRAGQDLCIATEGGAPTERTLYGLNRCDQLALKEQMRAIHDGDNFAGYRLFPRRQSNFRLMLSPVAAGQGRSVVHCTSGNFISMTNAMLNDPLEDDASCYDGDGKIDGSKLSVDLAKVKIDQLPIRVLYSPDRSFGAAEVLTEKNFTMRVLSSASIGGSYERLVNIKLPENRGGPPIPVIEVPLEYQNPEPLAIIHLDGRNSWSPFGEDRKPFQYFWEWAPGGRPPFAQDAVLIAPTSSFDNPRPITGQWVSEGYPKIYFPVAGTYKLRLKVKDSAGVESGPNDDCPTCPEWAQVDIRVKPSRKLHIELLWNRGDDVDMDLHLVRYRTDGTFGIAKALLQKMEITPTVMPGCTDSSDCFGGAFECGTNGVCENACTTDADCKAADPGWYCNTSMGQCLENPNGIIECETDDDCGSGFCSVGDLGFGGYKTFCTRYDSDSLNDTCYHGNRDPRWGDYEEILMGCQGNADCNGLGGDVFTCTDTCTCPAGEDCESASFDCCDFACTSSAQCLRVSEQFICDHDDGQCVGNSLDDDPSLDIDDTNGWGPENISVKEPKTGRYRIVARLFADPRGTVSGSAPLAPVRAYLQIYLNGELAISRGIAHEFPSVNTYWKVADVLWDSSKPAGTEGTLVPLCAGWTLTTCNNTDECSGWYGSQFQCGKREWGKFCSTCVGGSGTPEECNPTRTPCSTDADCASETTARTCAAIQGNYCNCPGSNEGGAFNQDPYANPFVSHLLGGMLRPNSQAMPASIWCDSAEATNFDGVPIFSNGASCSTLYP